MSPIDSTGNDDRKIHQDFDFVDTQPFDADGEEDDVCGYFEDTVPFGDDFVLETEAVDLAGETQALDDGDAFNDDDGVLETEAVNLAGETQALDGGDTQLLEEESDSDRTQVLEDADDDNDDEVSVDNVNGEALDNKKGESSQQNSSGSMPPRFTFLRAESLQQVALARNMDLKETQDVTNSVEGMSQFCQVPLTVKDNGGSFLRCSEKDEGVDQENKHGKYSMEVGGFKSKSMCKVTNSTVRKLFNDVLPVETNRPSLRSNDFNEGDDLDKLPIYHDELAGLSYVESQEPGVLSQDNALDFVDRFLKDNTVEFDQETNCVKKIEEKSKSVPSTKRQHSLAKTVNDRSKSGRTGIYDWDDNCEDEGGGDIFLRRKEDFFKGEMHRPRSLPGFQKSKACILNDDKEDKKQLSIPNRRKTAVHSDSKLGMHILKARDNIIPEATMLKRNLANELDEQFNTDCSRGEMEPNANACAPEMLDVGLDTQMAAEAMEALCNVGDIVDHVANDATHVTRSGLTYKVNYSSTEKVGSGSSKERSGRYDKKRKVDVKSKLQTSGLSKKSTKEVRQCTKDNMMTRSKRSKLNAEDQTSSANENGRVSLSPIIEQRKSAGALKRHQLDELNNPGGNNGEGRGSSADKRHLQNDVLLFTPIARRTRQSLAVNQLINVSDDAEMGTLDCPKGRRSLRIRKLSNEDKRSETLVGSCKPSAQPEDIGKYTADGKRKMRTDSVVKSHVNCQARSSLSLYDGSVISSVDRKQGKISELNSDKANPGDNINNSEVTNLDESPRERYKSSDLASATPAKCKTPVNDASPVCMGDEYYKQSCNRNLSRSCKELHRELQSLRDIRPELLTPSKDSRKRRDMTDVRILYSHHLDEDIVKHQKKILARLGVSVASSIADATHFVANQFVRTRNMLEAIAFGKPVVTHLWIESCGQASCFIDERNYILRDVKKEKELGFSMPVSLARAIQHPLLKGRRVLVTTNTKPRKEIVSNLARAVQGQVVEKVGRSVFKGDTISDDLLILSCEEDYASCVPFLEKGAMVYSSELLLNGIVTQKLEYQRHRLFADNVKKTRSTLWLKRDDRTFIPVT